MEEHIRKRHRHYSAKIALIDEVVLIKQPNIIPSEIRTKINKIFIYDKQTNTYILI